MIAVLLGAFQLAGAAAALVVRDATHSVRVPVIATAAGPMLRPEALSGMLPVTVTRDSGGMYTLEVWGTRLLLEAGVASVRIGADTRPLAAAPAVLEGHLIVPLQLVSEIFPGAVPNTRWDAEKGQLVLFTSVAAARLRAGRGQANPDEMSGARPTRSSGVLARAREPATRARHGLHTVIVDAGHGGVDNGMSGPIGGGPRIYEKNVTLDVATKLGEQLKRRGVDVVYTRTTDTLIALDDRGRIANRANGDLFISIHVNAANPNWTNPGGARGFETYFLSEARTEDARRVEHMENEAVQYEDASAGNKADALSFIVNDMFQNQHLRESSELAELIQSHLARMHPGPSRGVKQAGFRVLVTAYMPSVLVEIGFGTNPREAAFLSDSERQDAIAAAVADAAMAYLRRYEGRVAGLTTHNAPVASRP